MENQYNTQRYKRKKQWYRIKLGLMQFLYMPFLNILWLFVIIGAVFIFSCKNRALSAINVPQILASLLDGCMTAVFIVFILAIILALIQGIAELTARKDESDIMLAFDKKDLRNGSPILIYKKKIKKKGVTIREFYSTIPKEKWEGRKEAIADIMNIHFIGEIDYGGRYNGNRILMKTAKGRKSIEREVLYDDTF